MGTEIRHFRKQNSVKFPDVVYKVYGPYVIAGINQNFWWGKSVRISILTDLFYLKMFTDSDKSNLNYPTYDDFVIMGQN